MVVGQAMYRDGGLDRGVRHDSGSVLTPATVRRSHEGRVGKNSSEATLLVCSTGRVLVLCRVTTGVKRNVLETGALVSNGIGLTSKRASDIRGATSDPRQLILDAADENELAGVWA